MLNLQISCLDLQSDADQVVKYAYFYFHLKFVPVFKS